MAKGKLTVFTTTLVAAAMFVSPVLAGHLNVHTHSGGGYNHIGNTNVNVHVNDQHYNGGHYYHYHPGLAIAAGMAIGAALAYRPPNCTTEIVNGITYCYDGLNWYQVQGTTYIVVVRP